MAILGWTAFEAILITFTTGITIAGAFTLFCPNVSKTLDDLVRYGKVGKISDNKFVRMLSVPKRQVSQKLYADIRPFVFHFMNFVFIFHFLISHCRSAMLLDDFLYLWRQIRKANRKLNKLDRQLKNVDRKREGRPLFVPLATRLCKSLHQTFFPPLIDHLGNRAKTAIKDTVQNMCTLLATQLVGLLFFMIITLKFVSFPGPLGTYVGIGTQTTLMIMYLIPSIRCIVLVSVPGMTSENARRLLLLFIMAWALQGPAMNASRNIRGVVQSVACVQMELEGVTSQFNKNARQSFNRIGIDRLEAIRAQLRGPKRRFKMLLRTIHDSLESMSDTISEHWKRLELQDESCIRLLLTPHWMCRRLLEFGHDYCKDRIFPPLIGLCSLIANQENILCSSSRLLTKVCKLPDKVKNSMESGVLFYVKKNVDRALNETRRMFYFDLEFSHGYNTSLNLTTTDFKELRRQLHDRIDIYEVILSLASTFLDWLSGPLFILPLVMSAIYVFRFKISENYDNYFVNDQLRRIEETRSFNTEQQTILPLMSEERNTYTTCILHPRLARKERRKLVFSMLLIILSGVIPTLAILLDLAVYEISYAIYNFFGSNATFIESPSFFVLKVSGAGIVAELYRHLLGLVEPVNTLSDSDAQWRLCFIQPRPPDYPLFNLMAILFACCLLLRLLQVYMLRMRHLIAENFYPERCRPRGLFLYNQILKSRGNLFQILKLAIRKDGGGTRFLLDQFAGRSAVFGWLLPLVVAGRHQCSLCARTDMQLDISDSDNCGVCVHCQAVYCIQCFLGRRQCISCNRLFIVAVDQGVQKVDEVVVEEEKEHH